ncbi:hypothetical protein BCR37DRAFT_408340 [Protomyces lactucae-debilis]|uniref:Uncharacterized protein n=1 Tax=Protomyces lactucae-debilis TaxID=2754530 RepID=A0A1Y2FK98_PROLT|nr:uncharacterized protein BCR37DRAFT_408340 [Protomyces lactucae-debilis]ORY83794.1 hypothetical protein BCR37DRAFT_408340 [Protomyces lactucae-debilis]
MNKISKIVAATTPLVHTTLTPTMLWALALLLVQISIWQLQVSAKRCQEVTVVKWLNVSESYVKTLLRKPSASIFEGKRKHCRVLCRDYVHALYNVPKFASAPTGHAGLDDLIAVGLDFVNAQKNYLYEPDHCDFAPATACLSFWGWAQNAHKADASCSCGAIIRALRIKKEAISYNCSRTMVEQRFEDRFKPYGFYLFPAANNDDVDCLENGYDDDGQKCASPDTWQRNDLCKDNGGDKQLQPK